MSTLKVPVTDEDHIQGPKNAPITLLEYGDYECPACGAAFPITKLIEKDFGSQLRFVFRNFPLSEIHPHAEVAAETVEFAGAHKKFWEMHDLLYLNQDKIDLNLLFVLTRSLKLSEKELETALQNGIFRNKVKKDFMGGIYNGVNGTPTFFINGIRHTGSYAFEDLVDAINHQLAGVEA